MKFLFTLSLFCFTVFQTFSIILVPIPMIYVVKKEAENKYRIYRINGQDGDKLLLEPICNQFYGNPLEASFTQNYELYVLTDSSIVTTPYNDYILDCTLTNLNEKIKKIAISDYLVYQTNDSTLYSFNNQSQTTALDLPHKKIDDFTFNRNRMYYISYDSTTTTQSITSFDIANNSTVEIVSFQSNEAYTQLEAINYGPLYALAPSQRNETQIIKINANSTISYTIDTLDSNSEKLFLDHDGNYDFATIYLKNENQLITFNSYNKNISTATIPVADSIDKIGYTTLFDYYDFPYLPSFSYYSHDSLALAISSSGTLGEHKYTLGHKDSTLVFFTTVLPVSIKDQISNSNQIYPNPVQNILNLSFTEEIVSSKIISTSGFIISEKQSPDSYIDVSNLTSGVYILQLETNTGIETFKFTKE